MGLRDQLDKKNHDTVKSEETSEYRTGNEQEQESHQTPSLMIENEQELLMRLRAVEGYLSTVLQEVVQKEMTFQQEIENLVQISKSTEELMALTMKNSTESLNNRSVELENHTSNTSERLQALLGTYSSQLSKNQRILNEQLSEMQSTHLNQLNTSHKLISDELEQIGDLVNSNILAQQSRLEKMLANNTQKIETEMNNLKSRHDQQLNDISTSLTNEISSVKWKIFKTEWLDAGKQGLMTAIFLVPIYLLFRFIASLVGVDLP